MSDVFDYYKSSYAMQAADYPYNSAFPMVGDECKYDEKKATTCEVDDYTYADSGDISMMKLALSHQPIAAALDASMISFQSYSSGILDDDHHCSKTALNHSVLLIGYGHDYDGNEYWIGKNYWGTNWGEHGYFRIAMTVGDAGICGIQSNAVWPYLK